MQSHKDWSAANNLAAPLCKAQKPITKQGLVCAKKHPVAKQTSFLRSLVKSSIAPCLSCPCWQNANVILVHNGLNT